MAVAKINNDTFSTILSNITSAETLLKSVTPRFASVAERTRAKTASGRVVQTVDGFTVNYGISVGSEIDGDGATTTMFVMPELLDKLDVTVEQLHEAAVNNIAKEANLMFLNDMLKSMGMPEELAPEPVEGGFPMNIVTTNSGVRGAAAILSKEVQEEAYKKCGENYYILPSSVHEIIVVPESVVDDPLDLKKMVHEVNETQVPLEEQLSENVWFYDGTKIKIIA